MYKNACLVLEDVSELIEGWRTLGLLGGAAALGAGAFGIADDLGGSLDDYATHIKAAEGDVLSKVSALSLPSPEAVKIGIIGAKAAGVLSVGALAGSLVGSVVKDIKGTSNGEEKLSPDEFYDEYGKCPRRYRYDGKRCKKA